ALGHAIVDQQARLIAARLWPLRDQTRRQVVVELVDSHPDTTVHLPEMDDSAIERAKERVEQRADATAVDAVLKRAREQLEQLVTRLEQGLQERGGAIVYRIEDRRPDVAT